MVTGIIFLVLFFGGHINEAQFDLERCFIHNFEHGKILSS